MIIILYRMRKRENAFWRMIILVVLCMTCIIGIACCMNDSDVKDVEQVNCVYPFERYGK